ncbi:hypothetical protein [Marinicellulosiphila megalodicopiae]|uniref:hypothetical protein n=1 Tax=Marinicellulosiphila megalodicopiae TaxID=2724896 RepID=UPI003BAF221B
MHESKEYWKVFWGVSTQLDFKLLSIKNLSINATARPLNYYQEFGYSFDAGLKFKYSY